jgi:hypothetical protein
MLGYLIKQRFALFSEFGHAPALGAASSDQLSLLCRC